MIVSVYHGKWNSYDRNFQIADIPEKKIDRLYYAFFTPSLDSFLDDIYLDLEKDFPNSKSNYTNNPYIVKGKHIKGNFYELLMLKKKNPKLKIIASIGGWNNNSLFIDILTNREKISKFVKICSEFQSDFQMIFDGFDIDFEAISQINPENFSIFIEELKSKISLNSLLTMAISADPNQISLFNLNKIDKYIDSINIMTYDFTDPDYGHNFSGHHCNVYSNCNDPIEYRKNISCLNTISFLLKSNIDLRKINLGIAFYGRCFLFKENNKEPFLISSGKISSENVLTYYEIENKYDKKTWKWDPIAKAAYIKDDINNHFITFDDYYSILEKKNLAISQGLQGIFAWEISKDNKNFDLLNAMQK